MGNQVQEKQEKNDDDDDVADERSRGRDTYEHISIEEYKMKIGPDVDYSLYVGGYHFDEVSKTTFYELLKGKFYNELEIKTKSITGYNQKIKIAHNIPSMSPEELKSIKKEAKEIVI